MHKWNISAQHYDENGEGDGLSTTVGVVYAPTAQDAMRQYGRPSVARELRDVNKNGTYFEAQLADVIVVVQREN